MTSTRLAAYISMLDRFARLFLAHVEWEEASTVRCPERRTSYRLLHQKLGTIHCQPRMYLPGREIIYWVRMLSVFQKAETDTHPSSIEGRDAK